MLSKSNVLPDQANWPIEGARLAVLMKAKAEKPYLWAVARSVQAFSIVSSEGWAVGMRCWEEQGR